MGTTWNNIGACAKSMLTGQKYGGVLIGDKLTLVPSKKLTKFVDRAHTHGFSFESYYKPLSSQKSSEFVRRLASIGKGTVIDSGKYYYSQLGGGSFLTKAVNGKQKEVVRIVERLSSPTKDFLKNIRRRVISYGKSILPKIKNLIK